MKKSDLKTGYRVTTERGHQYIVLLNTEHVFDKVTDALVDPTSGCWLKLSSYDDDLKYSGTSDGYNIVKIEKPQHVYDVFKYWKGYVTVEEREEETEQQRKVRELEEKLEAHKATMKELEEKIKGMKE